MGERAALDLGLLKLSLFPQPRGLKVGGETNVLLSNALWMLAPRPSADLVTKRYHPGVPEELCGMLNASWAPRAFASGAHAAVCSDALAEGYYCREPPAAIPSRHRAAQVFICWLCIVREP